MTQAILIVGATSGIAQAFARRFAQRGARFFLVARDSAKVESVAADLRARGARAVNIFVMDANDTGRLDLMLQNAWQALERVDFALVAHGTLPDATRASVDRAYLVQQFRTNAESVIVCLAGLAQRFQSQGSGVLGVIGSVAGDRGRASNYAYGAAKAAVHAFASGLRAQLFRHGVHVVTIKPGFVATQMTAHLDLPARLTAQPDTVAARIESAMESRRNVVYTPGFWWVVMAIIRSLPEALFKRFRL
jgi:decaprenylphospho-beta-D-erythro-pentofuranosid-2-ulose 2-reductase